MADELIARFRRWFDYERDAHNKVLASLDTVPAERRGGPEYRKAVALFAHIVGAREVWLYRLGVIPKGTGGLFPDDPQLDAVVTAWRVNEEQWAAYLARLSDADLERVFDYRSFDGGHFRNTIEEVLTQMFGHSWYHRGQIAVLVRAAGGTPAVTDFVYWCREPVVS
jgi:uncharacterized damage-inducible protein DinB